MRETFDKPPANGRRGSEVETWSAPRPAQPRIVAGEVSTEMPVVLKMPWRRRFAARWNEMVRETASAFRAQPGNKPSWIPLVALLLTAAIAVAGFARSFWVTEGRANSEAQQLIDAAKEIREGMVTMKGELMGEVAGIRGAVATQQRQVDKLEAEMKAQLEQKDKDIARLELDVKTAMAYAQSADKNIARLQERVNKNGG